MYKIDQIEKFIAYQKTTDKSPLTLSSYQNDLMQFALWFKKVNNDELRLHSLLIASSTLFLPSNLRPLTCRIADLI